MKPYFNTSNLRWLGYLFIPAGAVFLILAGLQRGGYLPFDASQALWSFILVGFGLVLWGLSCALDKQEWKLQIDERSMQWTDGRKSGKILTKTIKRVRVEEGDGAFLIVETADDVKHYIPRIFYGQAEDLREWFKSNLGSQLDEVK